MGIGTGIGTGIGAGTGTGIGTGVGGIETPSSNRSSFSTATLELQNTGSNSNKTGFMQRISSTIGLGTPSATRKEGLNGNGMEETKMHSNNDGNNSSNNNNNNNNNNNSSSALWSEFGKLHQDGVSKHRTLCQESFADEYKNDSLVLWHLCQYYLPLRDKLHNQDLLYRQQLVKCNQLYHNYELIREQSLEKLKALELWRLCCLYDSYHILAKFIQSDMFNVTSRRCFVNFKTSIDRLSPEQTFNSFLRSKFSQTLPRSVGLVPYAVREWRTTQHLLDDLMFHQTPVYDGLHVPFVLEYLLTYIENDPHVADGKDTYLLLQPNLHLLDDKDTKEYQLILQQIFALSNIRPVNINTNTNTNNNNNNTNTNANAAEDAKKKRSSTVVTKSPVIRDYKHAVGILKFWLKNLVEPIIPYHLYSKCLLFEKEIVGYVRRRAQRKSLKLYSHQMRNGVHHFPLHNELDSEEDNDNDHDHDHDNDNDNDRSNNNNNNNNK
ncbi:patatin family protein [Reticulomyxa filosa]|uniref:Patatin family protein n=1 Tax=Reticulomyxa filosa TaxID=46433 RepID=X6MC69_RETFI|nr:patatin family protein [Reticulomyxa filosa]|eukprot:ETO11444.1 patatin family protein [Reticulomyxa filosa]